MTSAAEQLASQEEIAEAPGRQMDGQHTVPQSQSHQLQERGMPQGRDGGVSQQGAGGGGKGVPAAAAAAAAAGCGENGAVSGKAGPESDVQSESDEDPSEDAEANKARKKLRRACDYCTEKKVRCDGSRPCRQCKRRQLDCKFSMSQRAGQRSTMHQPDFFGGAGMHHGPGSAAAASALAAAAASATAAAAAIGGAGPPPSNQMTIALSGGGITSKVDVTYLNFFLKEFNAFVPLTTQEILRDALNPVPAALSSRNPDGDEEYRRQNARVAVIQGCISVGAMIKAQTQIVSYMRTVREALSHCFDLVSPETMTAYLVVAYCHDLMGNPAATRNYMELAKAVATQLPHVTAEHELVFQFYRVCSEVHNSTLSATPKLLQQAGTASAPCYQVLNVLTYSFYDLAHLAKEELANNISRQQVTAELRSLHPILARADIMSRDNTSSFGALGMLMIKGVLAYVLVRLGRSQEGLQVLEPVAGLLSENPGLLRQVMCWHLSHCVLVIFLEHGWFKEYETVRVVYNRLLEPPERGGQHFVPWKKGNFQDATRFPPVDRLHTYGSSFLCTNPICRVINRDLSDGVDVGVADQGELASGGGSCDGEGAKFCSGGGLEQSAGAQGQPLMNMVAGSGFLNFDSQSGVNVTGSTDASIMPPDQQRQHHHQRRLSSTPPPRPAVATSADGSTFNGRSGSSAGAGSGGNPGCSSSNAHTGKHPATNKAPATTTTATTATATTATATTTTTATATTCKTSDSPMITDSMEFFGSSSAACGDKPSERTSTGSGTSTMSATSSSGGSSAGAEIQNVAPRGARGAVQPEEQGDGGSTARMGEANTRSS